MFNTATPIPGLGRAVFVILATIAVAFWGGFALGAWLF